MKQILLLTLFLVTIGVFAQQKDQDTIRINEVRIDVSKQNQKIQQIPLSVTAVSAKEIEVQKIEDVTDLNGLIPNFFIPEHGTRLNTDIYIRGIGVSKGEPSIGMYVDDIPYFDSGTINFEFANIKKIEVLRGPQGTLYGRNTMGGLLKIYTPDPVQKRKAGFKLDYGRYNQYKASVSYNQPLTENSAVLLDAYYKNDDGYFVNKYDNNNVDAEQTYGLRLKYKINLTNNLKLKVLGNYEKNNQPGFAYGVYDSQTQTVNEVNYNEPSKYNRDFGSTGINLKYNPSGYEVNLSAGYQQLKDVYLIDQDFTPNDIYVVDMDRNNNAFVEELNIKSTTDSPFQWIGGMFSFQRHLLKNVDFDITTNHGKMTILKDYDQSIKAYAAFGQISYKRNKLLFAAGLRYDKENAELDYNYDLLVGGNKVHKDDFEHTLNFDQFLPKFSVSYLPNKHFTAYATVAKGYKAGGFNATIERDEDETYNPEYSLNYETGFKFNGLNNKLVLNTSLFYIDWQSQQVVQSVPSGRGIMIKNAGKSESKGVEIESFYRFTPDFNLGVSYGYTDAYFISYKYNDSTDYSNNKLPMVPEYTLGAAANYKWRLKSEKFKYVLFNLNYKRYGKYYWTSDNTDYQNPYGVLNANISLKTRNASIGLWAKNITNEKFIKYYFTISTLQKAYAELSRPVSFGIYAKVNLF